MIGIEAPLDHAQGPAPRVEKLHGQEAVTWVWLDVSKPWHRPARRMKVHDPGLVSAVSLNGNRHVTGVLRGFDQFMNVVLDNTIDDKSKTDIGMVVSL